MRRALGAELEVAFHGGTALALEGDTAGEQVEEGVLRAVQQVQAHPLDQPKAVAGDGLLGRGAADGVGVEGQRQQQDERDQRRPPPPVGGQVQGSGPRADSTPQLPVSHSSIMLAAGPPSTAEGGLTPPYTHARLRLSAIPSHAQSVLTERGSGNFHEPMA